MENKIYKLISKYDNIVIARHVGPDPDAVASQIALRDSIKLTFPKKMYMQLEHQFHVLKVMVI